MSEAFVQSGAEGELRLSGVLDYQTGPALRRAGQELIGNGKAKRVLIDCSGVEKSSSEVGALLVAVTSDAMGAGRDVLIVGMPEDMREIARVSGLLDVLALADETQGAV